MSTANEIGQFYNRHFFGENGKPCPVTVSVTIRVGEEALELPAVSIDADKAIDVLFHRAYELASQGPAAAPIEAPAAERTIIPAESEEEPPLPPQIDYHDFAEIEYKGKKYYLEALNDGGYRVTKDDHERTELNPSGPVFRSVVKQYEIQQGLREE